MATTPRDHDGHFSGLNDGIADVSTVRPDSDFRLNDPPASPFKPWKIYPPPPPPRWHWKDKEKAVSSDGNSARVECEFVFEDCPIPDPHSWGFEIDDMGVFQVYENIEGDLELAGSHGIHPITKFQPKIRNRFSMSQQHESIS